VQHTKPPVTPIVSPVAASPVASHHALHAASFASLGRHTDESRAGLFVWPGLAGTRLSEHETRTLEKYRPSGVVLFRRNLASLAQGQALVKDIRAILPGCVVSIDEEGGRVARLPWPVPRGLTALQLGDARDFSKAESQTLLQAMVSRGLGIDTIFAPVADILTREHNPVMDERCYGRDADTVSRFVEVACSALASQGVRGCVKHFPGHGNTTTDSHYDFAESDADLETLRAREWEPFRRAFARGVSLCMTAHVRVPALDPKFPATLSRTVLQAYLREELGFDGLVVSDDLRMKAVALHYGVKNHVTSAAIVSDIGGDVAGAKSGYLARAGVDALAAGCDILLSCQSVVLEEELLAGVALALKTNAAFSTEMEGRLFRFVKTGVLGDPVSAAL